VSAVDTSVQALGTRLSTPAGVAPTGFHRLAHPEGEVATAAGAARAGALFVLSTRSTRRIEDVAAAAGPWWFQTYVMRDRSLTAGLVRRAAAAGASALVLTGDTPEVGRKQRGGSPPVSDADYFVNLGQDVDPDGTGQNPAATLADIEWLRELGNGLPVLVKGVLRADDAVACAEHGAAGVIVSNHGGRQLDGAIATARALPAVTAALAGSGIEVYADGGVRSGPDVLAALALGARAVFTGRPALWALACGGADGVCDLLTGLTEEVRHAMALAGVTSPAQAPEALART
jgi:4-hydroxymandelate oxidase